MKVRKYWAGSQGQIITLMALSVVVLGLFIGLALDGGRAYLLRSRLSKIADSMALAGAKAIAGSGTPTEAMAAACDVALLNGIPVGECGGSSSGSTKVVVQAIKSGATADCSSPPCVIVSAFDSMNTTFMRLGKLIGCSTCDSLSISAAAVASFEVELSDMVLNLDDTGSMKGQRIKKAKSGAQTLVNSVVSSSVHLGLVPFRGCYNSTGNNKCKDQDDIPNGDIVPLTDFESDLISGINALDGGGGSGTNVCEGLVKAREKLFESGKVQPNSRKFMVLLTDADSNPKTTEPVSTDCNAGGGQQLDQQTYDKATDIKKGQNVGSSGQNPGETVEIFVIHYGTGSDNPNPPACDPDIIGTQKNDLNLARCLASSDSHYLAAPTPQAIEAQFDTIVEIMKALRLVS
jgi:hypothetical protein